MPNGQAHLMVNLAEDEFKTYPAPRSEHICKHSGAVFAGPHAKSVVIDTRRRWRCRSAGKSCACWWKKSSSALILYHPAFDSHCSQQRISSKRSWFCSLQTTRLERT